MKSALPPPDSFAEAGKIWYLERLYADLASVKREKLTPSEKEHLRGLLLGLGPKEIAQALFKGVGGVRVALCALYRYIEILVGLPEGEVNSRSAARVLEEAGYKGNNDPGLLRSQPPTPEPVNQPPLAEAELELPWGQVHLVSKFYVERPPIEWRCFDSILKPGALIRIKAPRQMGKTSLLSRILYHAEKHNCLTMPLSFQLADGEVFSSLDRFLRWFCANVSLALQLPNRLTDYWDDIFGSKINCKAYFEQYLLPKIDTPLVLGLDEVDCIFQYPAIAVDFFGLLRAWHEEAKNREIWKKLRLIVVHATEVYVPLENNQSPFNVGLPIELSEFTPEQVQDLAQRHGLDWQAEQVGKLMNLVGGHPYLVRVALYQIACQDLTLEQLLKIAPTGNGPYSDHLWRHRACLEQNPDLKAAFTKAVAKYGPVRLEATQAFKLSSMGLVYLNSNYVTVRCELYRKYFRDRQLT